MNKFKCLPLAVLIVMGAAQPAFAKGDSEKEFVIVNEAVGVPVFPHDITDRPYEVIKEVKAGVRKATIFSKEASQEKIYKELWERAEKLDADAVINAQYGDSHVSAFSWGKTNATGMAIRFIDAPAPAVPAPAATPAEVTPTTVADAATPAVADAASPAVTDAAAPADSPAGIETPVATDPSEND